MKDLNAYPSPYPERENGCYLIVPIFMLTHNPSVLQAKTSMIPNYTNLERTQYQKEVFAELTSPHLPKPQCEIGPGCIYNDAEVCTECELETQDLIQQLSAVEKPDAVIKKKHNTVADDLGDETWTKQQRASNGRRVEIDMEVDAMNPDYMYPDLSMPWNNRYMKQKDPELRNYWSGLYKDLPEDFKPDAAHTYKEDELVALAKESPASEKKGKKWPTILQEA